MMYRCINQNCPHYSEPCEISTAAYDTRCIRYTTPCPIGEYDYFQLVNDDDEFFCMVVGSRTFTNYVIFCRKMDKLLQNKLKKTIVIVTGGAEGTDAMAERYAKERGYQLLIMRADFNSYGKKAGYIRNERMHKYISEKEDRAVVAFWDGKSKGTAHSFELAKKYNNQIRIIHCEKYVTN